MKLRKITLQFRSLKLEGKIWVQPSVLLMPADNSINDTPERRGKVVIIGTGGWVVLPARIEMYADPIVTRTGYPVMCVHSPGNYADGTPVEGDLAPLTRIRKETGKNYYNMNCQLALDLHSAPWMCWRRSSKPAHVKAGDRRPLKVAAAAQPWLCGHGSRAWPAWSSWATKASHRTDQIQWHLELPSRLFPGPGACAGALHRRDQRRRLQDVQRQHHAGTPQDGR